MHFSALLAFSAAALAGAVPQYPGFKTIWSDDFPGNAGDLPNTGLWQVTTGLHVNNEAQDYTTSNRNIQISGGGTVQLVPNKDGSGKWTSGRIESKTAFTPQQGKITMVDAVIRFGDGAQSTKQGIWPAFWLLGESIRHGTPWPQCGELDIMETINGAPTAYGTVHCGTPSGGPCNEPVGRASTVGLGDNGWHRWSIKIDRTNSDWRAESIQWLMDGNVYNTVRGSDINDQAVWSTLAHSPMFVILNVAVGGNWPGSPNGNTQGSWGSMMEVEYVGVYSN
ncbi:beta-glucanase [Echria macrotheca]|uniref:Beta-glucanase n=1 Tax=Echria macrotheca TaxID=438768 RepID=A0AAJ0F2B4_9PEZI|nr:beta-glucanase [Echria macrotheca]